MQLFVGFQSKVLPRTSSKDLTDGDNVEQTIALDPVEGNKETLTSAVKTMVQPAESGKSKGKWCFRCRSKGHVSTECSTILFCAICEGRDHVAASCPTKKKAKPMAFSVGYVIDGLGFFHIPHPPLSGPKTEGSKALISVQGGVLSEAEVVSHLQRLLPENMSGMCSFRHRING